MRYRVLDLPSKGVGAFTPIPTTNPPASSFGLVKVSAAMGLDAIPVQPYSKELPPMSWQNQTKPSYCAPDAILPDQYVAHADNMGPCADAGIGMSMRRHNPLPVPALSWIAVSPNALRNKRYGGRFAIPWPRAFQRWGNQSPTPAPGGSG